MPTLSEPTTDLGARLRELRLVNEWTQWDVAHMLGTRANRVSDWETGKHEPSLPVLKKFGDIYGYTVAEMLEGVM